MLVVEDNRDVADAMRILFEHNGYRVSSATTVAEAVRIGVHDPPEVVLLDVSLHAGEDGLEIIARWKERGAALPRIFALTGHADEATRERCSAAGCEAVLLKPVPTADLVARVTAAR